MDYATSLRAVSRAVRGARAQAAGVWGRRMPHEPAIHRLDAELAAGGDPELLFDPDLAAGAGVVGSLDAVYRAVWGRAGTAVSSGDKELLRRGPVP